jgi:DNA-directed RNA polymerase specialized sigma24 family protein
MAAASASTTAEPTLEALLKQWNRFVHHLAIRHARRLGVDPDDFAQAIRLAAVRKWPQYRKSNGAFSTWLSGCVAWAATSHWRPERLHTVPTTSLATRVLTGNSRHPKTVGDLEPDPKVSDPAEEADRSLLRQRVAAALADLHPADAELVRREFWHGDLIDRHGRERLRQVLVRLGEVLEPLDV